VLSLSCVRHAASLSAFPNLSADEWSKSAWPVLGVAVNVNDGSMQVCWALVQKRESQQTNTQSNKRPEYVIYNLLEKVHQATHATVTIHTVESVKAGSKMDPGHCVWETAFADKKGPIISKENGNKFFPYVRILLSDRKYKVNHKLGVSLLSAQNSLTSFNPHSVFSSVTTSE
jgi:hypothetical protein